ncbi:response regulator [Hymenobacter sp. BT491]|uniref:response regulator n=1 Tax=Hymenobacter sp. BT491 TaxID=2766779 RepID=UPI001653B8F2|nr:response regulator [Hymenobacter sp. BT491]MBC6991844.1 response regulator [Hymenobacter sp. BT491]
MSASLSLSASKEELLAALTQAENRILQLESALAQATAVQVITPAGTDAQLAEQRSFYETILAELPIEVVVLDEAQRYLYANPHAVADPVARHWLLGHTLTDYCTQYGHPLAYAEQRQAKFKQALSNQHSISWIEESPSEDGARYYQRNFKVILHPDGSLRMMLGYGLDVTERYLAEEKLRQSELQLLEQQEFANQVLDTNPSMIYVRDATGRFTFQNRGMKQLRALGERLEDYDQSYPQASIQAQERQIYAAAESYVRDTREEIVSEDPFTLPSGEVLYFQTVRRPIERPDGSVEVLAVSTNITDLKRIQETLQRSEKQYRDLMHYAQALICTHDLNGNVLSVNPALATLLKRPAEAIVGRSLAATMPAEDQEGFAEYLQQIITNQEVTGLQRILPDGSTELRYVHYRNYLVQETNHAPYVLSHAHDITERILAEKEMKRARYEAEATARARENFLANMSHEIRTPMNGILGYANLLAKSQLSPIQQQQLNVIRSSGQHLLAVLNDVLDMAKITSGKLELDQTAFNLCDSMGQAVQPLALQAAEKGLAFYATPLRLSCPLPWVVGDQYRINQILINLVANAVKFTKQGSITVKGLLLAETDSQLTVQFSVADTGIGIPEDKKAHIFEDFTQAYTDTTRNYGGTGLGLSISRALVAQMGGTLHLESELGKGSTFAFTLSLPRAPLSVPVERPKNTDTTRLAGKRVLLVEDNEINRDVARLFLEDWGVQVDEAADGNLAVALFKHYTYDVVLMDIQMPGMNGLETTAHLRRHPDPRRAATPILALTANAFRSDNEQYLAAGMNDCLAKPFEEEDLFQKLEALLNTPPPAPLYDLTHLRDLSRGREAFVAKIIRSFLTNIPVSLEELRVAAEAGLWPKAAELLHHIKPNLLSLGIAGAEEPLQQLERLRQASNPSPAEAEQLRAIVLSLIAHIEQVLQALPHEVTEQDSQPIH